MKYYIDSAVTSFVGLAYLIAPTTCAQFYFSNEIDADAVQRAAFVLQAMGAVLFGIAGFLCLGERLANGAFQIACALVHAAFSALLVYCLSLDMPALGLQPGPLYFWLAYHVGYTLCFFTAPVPQKKTKSS